MAIRYFRTIVRPRAASAIGVASVLAVSGCGELASVPRPTDDPEPQIPGQEEEPFDLIGEGTSNGLGWRLLSYSGPDGSVCLQVDTAESGGANCDEPNDESAIWMLTYGADLTHDGERYEPIYGFASAEAARIDLHYTSGRVEAVERLPTRVGDRDAFAFTLLHLEDDTVRAPDRL